VPTQRSLLPMLRSALGVLVGLLLLGAVVAGSAYLSKALIRDVGPPPPELPRNEAAIPKRDDAGRKAERPPRKVWLLVTEDSRNAPGGEDLGPAERTARDFTAAGVSFSTPPGDLKRQAPLAVVTDVEKGKTSYTWDGEGGTRYEVVLSTGVESIALTEDEQDYEDMLRECQDKLGPPSREGEADGLGPTYFYWWYFPSVGRSVALGKTEGGGRVRSYLLVTAAYRSQAKDVKAGR